ncbi:hypothetical protein ACWGDX_11335 [Streptomyces sp. NPDC055025]
MSDTLEVIDLDTLIDDLEAQITDTELPDAQMATQVCSGLCTIIICTLIVC